MRIVTDRMTVWPKGRALPKSLLDQEWPVRRPNPGPLSAIDACSGAQQQCDAFLVDLDRDGREEVLIAQMRGRVDLYVQNDNGSWAHAGLFQTSGCSALRDGLVSGKFELGASRWPSIEAGGDRFVFTEIAPDCKGSYRVD